MTQQNFASRMRAEVYDQGGVSQHNLYQLKIENDTSAHLRGRVSSVHANTATHWLRRSFITMFLKV